MLTSSAGNASTAGHRPRSIRLLLFLTESPGVRPPRRIIPLTVTNAMNWCLRDRCLEPHRREDLETLTPGDRSPGHIHRPRSGSVIPLRGRRPSLLLRPSALSLMQEHRTMLWLVRDEEARAATSSSVRRDTGRGPLDRSS